jgi:DNA-binding MarR family transcriptional regulator
MLPNGAGSFMSSGSFALTNKPLASYLDGMTLDQAVEDQRVSQRDAAILSHCSPDAPRVPAQLARHLDLARSTLSEALKKLELLRYLRKVSDVIGDGRPVGVLLTANGCRDTASSKGGTP